LCSCIIKPDAPNGNLVLNNATTGDPRATGRQDGRSLLAETAASGWRTAQAVRGGGARVAITGRNKETLEAAARELGPNELAIVADANRHCCTEAAIKQAVAKFGKLERRVRQCRIAGRQRASAPLRSTFEKVHQHQTSRRCSVPCRRQAEITMTAPHHPKRLGDLRLGNPVIPPMRRAGRRARDGRVMASELSPAHPRQRGLAGAIRTPIWGAALATPKPRRRREAHPAPHAARPHRRTDHISKTVLFLASDCRAYPGQEFVRRWWRYGLAKRRNRSIGGKRSRKSESVSAFR